MNIRLLLLQKRITQENNMKDSGGTNQNLIFILLLVMVGGVIVLYMTMRAPAEEDALAQSWVKLHKFNLALGRLFILARPDDVLGLRGFKP